MNSALAVSQKHEQATERLQNKTVTNFSEYIYIYIFYIHLHSVLFLFLSPIHIYTLKILVSWREARG